MLMIVRERRREIGVLKAIGSSNIRIVGQFVTEALTLTLAGSVIGAGGVLLSTPSQAPHHQLRRRRRRSGPGGGFTRRCPGIGLGGQSFQNLSCCGLRYPLYGPGYILAVLGSAPPALPSPVRPADNEGE
jgi:putative ABC transport system permease protein